MVSQAASRAVGKLSASTCDIQPFAKPCASSVSMKRSGVQLHIAIAISVWLETGQMQSLGMGGGNTAIYVLTQPNTHALAAHVASHCHNGCAQHQAD